MQWRLQNLKKMTEQEQIEILKQKLRVAEKALNDIMKWDDDLEDEWGDPGERANAALEKIMIINLFFTMANLDKQAAYFGVEYKMLEDGRMKVSQTELKTAKILTQKELVTLGKQAFPELKIVPSVFSLNLDTITVDWILERMDRYNIKARDICKHLAFNKSELSKILSGNISLSKKAKAAFFFYFRNFELMEDFEDFMKIAK